MLLSFFSSLFSPPVNSLDTLVEEKFEKITRRRGMYCLSPSLGGGSAKWADSLYPLSIESFSQDMEPS